MYVAWLLGILSCPYRHNLLFLRLQPSQKFCSQLQSATSKDEALTLAISAAENLMGAMKLSSDPQEKKRLKAQCSDIMTAAGRIKSDANWTPLVEPPQAQAHRMNIDRWAEEVVSAQSTNIDHEDSTSLSSFSRPGVASTIAPVHDVSVSSGTTSFSSV
jgi:hypothetical protein